MNFHRTILVCMPALLALGCASPQAPARAYKDGYRAGLKAAKRPVLGGGPMGSCRSRMGQYREAVTNLRRHLDRCREILENDK